MKQWAKASPIARFHKFANSIGLTPISANSLSGKATKPRVWSQDGPHERNWSQRPQPEVSTRGRRPWQCGRMTVIGSPHGRLRECVRALKPTVSLCTFHTPGGSSAAAAAWFSSGHPFAPIRARRSLGRCNQGATATVNNGGRIDRLRLHDLENVNTMRRKDRLTATVVRLDRLAWQHANGLYRRCANAAPRSYRNLGPRTGFTATNFKSAMTTREKVTRARVLHRNFSHMVSVERLNNGRGLRFGDCTAAGPRHMSCIDRTAGCPAEVDVGVRESS